MSASNVVARSVATQPALCPKCKKGIRPGQRISLVVAGWIHEECA